MKPHQSDEQILVKVAQELDQSPGLHFRSKKPVIIRKVFVEERTRLPKIILATAVASTIFAGTFYFIEKGKLQRERRIAEEHFREILRPASAKQQVPPRVVQKPSTAGEPVRTAPTVRAVTAESNGQDVRR